MSQSPNMTKHLKEPKICYLGCVERSESAFPILTCAIDAEAIIEAVKPILTVPTRRGSPPDTLTLTSYTPGSGFESISPTENKLLEIIQKLENIKQIINSKIRSYTMFKNGNQ